jgi:hypothetical protein
MEDGRKRENGSKRTVHSAIREMHAEFGPDLQQ